MNLLRDVRYAVRLLLKAPAYTTAAVLTLALAVAANGAIFGVVHAVLLEPLPVHEPGRVTVIWDVDASRDLAVVELPYRLIEHWAANSRSFSGMAAMGSSLWPSFLDGRGEPARVSIAGVSGAFFDTLGASPLLGRVLTAGDDVPNAPPVVVLSYGTWVRRFGGDPNVVGTIAELGTHRTIVGVMPRDFDFPRGAEFWVPVVPLLSALARPDFDALQHIGVLFAVGRLHDGVSPESAVAELDALAAALGSTGSRVRFGTAMKGTPFLDYLLGPVRQALWAVWVAVAVLLLIACANISGLMLTRVTRRRHDHAVRLALGATARHLGRLWVVEAMVVAVVGGVVGWALAGSLLKVIVALAPGDVLRLSDATLSPTVGLFTFMVMLAAALFCGIGPARLARATVVVEALGDAGRTTAGRRTLKTRSSLVVVQIALAIVLLVSAGLVVRSFGALRRLDVGFVPAGVVSMYVSGPSNVWMQQLLDRLEGSPAITAAGAIYLRPLELGPIGQETSVVLEGQVDTPQTRQGNPTLNLQVATSGYFRAMRIKLVSGRFFTKDDGPDAPRVAIVSEGTAARLWPGQDPVGRRIHLPASDGAAVWRTVVGVVGDVHYRGLGDVRLDVYDAALQSSSGASYLVVRTSVDPLTTASLVRTEAQRLDAGVIVDSVTTLDAVVARAVAPWRFTTGMLTLFAAFGFLLAAVGLFSVVSLDVTSRHRELAVRVALGAQRTDVIRHVLKPAARHVVAGALVGAAAGAAGARALRSFLFGVAPFDLVTWAAVFVLVAAVVTLASYLPARRAAGVDPSALLRRE